MTARVVIEAAFLGVTFLLLLRALVVYRQARRYLDEALAKHARAEEALRESEGMLNDARVLRLAAQKGRRGR